MLEALYTFLSGQSTLTALIGDELYPAHLPQSAEYPAVVFTLISATHEHTLDGGAGVVNCRVQFNIFSYDPTESAAIQEALRLILQGYTGDMGTATVHGKVTLIQDMDLTGDPNEGTDEWVYLRASDYLIRFQEQST